MLSGFVGLYRLKSSFYELAVEEKWLLAGFALFSIVSIVSFLYWPPTRETRMHLENCATFMMLLPLYLLLRQFRFDFNCVLLLLVLGAVELGLLSLLSDRARPSGAVNSMRYGNISLVLAVIPLAAMLLIRNKALAFKFLLVVASVLGFAGCLLTQSRGGFTFNPCSGICLRYIFVPYWAFQAFNCFLDGGCIACVGR